MRRLLAVAAAAVAVVAAPASADARRIRHCKLPAGAVVRAKNARVVVYQRDVGRVRRIVGCLLHTGGRTRLADVHPSDQRARRIEVARQYAALVLDTFDRIDQAQFVVARSYDLRDGRVKWSSVAGYNDGGQGTSFAVPSLALARNGAFAYIVITSHRTSGSRTARVRIRSRHGSRTADSGSADPSTGIDRRSLELDGLTARWTHAGEGRSASLH